MITPWQMAYVNIESGKRNISVTELMKLSELLSFSPWCVKPVLFRDGIVAPDYWLLASLVSTVPDIFFQYIQRSTAAGGYEITGRP